MIKNKLNIIKYNYLKEYSKIEVEIYPKENTSDNFINIDDENKSYYHIYFNNERKEVKKYNYNEKDKINKIKIIIDYEVKTLDSLFESCNCIKSINFIKFNRNDINNMSKMFSKCQKIRDFSFFKI